MHLSGELDCVVEKKKYDANAKVLDIRQNIVRRGKTELGKKLTLKKTQNQLSKVLNTNFQKSRNPKAFYQE